MRWFFLGASLLVVAACSGGGAPNAANSLPEGALPATRALRSETKIASIEIDLPVSKLPLGGTMTFSIVAKDSKGRVISGAYDHPIHLSASDLALSTASIATSSEAASIAAAWNFGFAGGGNGSIRASADGRQTTATIAPGTGLAYVLVGSDPNTDSGSFVMTLGPDGDVYYVADGDTDGAVGRIDPATGSFSEVETGCSERGLQFTSDGALWIGGGTCGAVLRLPPHAFSKSALQTIPVPSPSAPGSTYQIRSLAQDGKGNLWFDDGPGGRLFKIPVAGPYTTAALTAYAMPAGPPDTTPQFPPDGQGIDYGTDGNLYVVDYDNGIVDRIDPATGTASAQLVPQQQLAVGSGNSVRTRFVTHLASGREYVSMLGASGANTPEGAVDGFAPGSSRVTPVALPSTPAGTYPDQLAASGSYLYYADVLYGAIGIIDTDAKTARLYPTSLVSASTCANCVGRFVPEGIAALPNGDVWFTCQNGQTPFVPLCLGHTVYLSGWSLLPGPSVAIAGLGASGAQTVGIMERPASDSGPFHAKSSDSTICSVSSVVDHNFSITGIAPGTCIVTVTDASKNGVTLHVIVKP